MSDPNSARPNSSQSHGNKIKEAMLQADTVARRAANIGSFGLANNAEAAWDALFDKSPGDWLAHYKASLQEQLNRDYYDAAHRHAATLLGNGIGIGLLTADAAGLGADVSAGLSNRAKGKLGEGLSAAKTVLKGDWPVEFQVRKRLPDGRSTVLDHQTARGGYVEAKFGPRADLTPNQRVAQDVWSPIYRVDRWLPWHVGALSAPVGTAGGLLSWGMQQPPGSDQQDPNSPGS